MEQQKIKYELDQLKNQIDPHFLFNSLNSLIGLIEENPVSASAAAQELSDLYRNILIYEKADLIPVQKEIDLAKKYFNIHKIRFEDLIDLQIKVRKNEEGKVLPLSCQFLIENAIKHNIINQNNKLNIKIEQHNGFLVVSNNLNPLLKETYRSTKLGLDNLIARYSYLSKSKVVVEKNENKFTVKIPIIHD